MVSGRRLQAGDLKEKITFQTPTRNADGGGGFVQTWADITPNPSVRAAIEPIQDRVRLEALQVELGKGYSITIRRRLDLNLKMRISWGSYYLRIVDLPRVLQTQGFMVLLAEVINE